MSVITLEDPRLARLAEDNMDTYDLDGSVRLEFNGRYFDVPYRGMNATVNFIYRSGYCAFLALALHELTDLPLAVFTIPDENEWLGHVAIKVGEDAYLDIAGISTEEEINHYYGFDNHGMELLVAHDVEDALVVFHETVQSSPWAFLSELEELITRDYAEQLADKYL